MTKIVDKGALLLLGLLLVGYSDWVTPVVAALLGVIAAALGICLTDIKSRNIYMIIFLVTCFWLPELIYFLPIIFYDCAMEQRLWGCYGVAPVYAVYYVNSRWMSVEELMLWIVLLGIGIVLGRRTGRMEHLETEMIRLRDTSTELNLVLREKNKNLMEKQDYEIYLATLRERNRIAREIHDNVGHMLSRSILQIGALTTIHKEEPLHEQLGSVNETLNQAMNSIRESVHDLHDDSIDLRQAIMDATREMQERYRVTIDYDMSPEVPRNVKYCFITTIKEAMSNIVKHSDADRIALILREHPGFYQLTVEDNGGIKAAGASNGLETGRTAGALATGMAGELGTASMGSEGIGLGNMRERVEALQGTFRIHRENGFQIFISIPKHQGAIER